MGPHLCQKRACICVRNRIPLVLEQRNPLPFEMASDWCQRWDFPGIRSGIQLVLEITLVSEIPYDWCKKWDLIGVSTGRSGISVASLVISHFC